MVAVKTGGSSRPWRHCSGGTLISKRVYIRHVRDSGSLNKVVVIEGKEFEKTFTTERTELD